MLPHRFRHEAFTYYEPTIATIVRVFPQRLDLSPATFKDRHGNALSPVTISCRLRDAIRSLKTNRWPTSTIDMVRFDQIADAIIVSERTSGLVVVGDKQSVKDPTNPRPMVGSAIPFSGEVLTFENPSADVVVAITRMLEAHTDQVRLVGVKESLLQTLYENYDIAFEVQMDGSFIVT